VDPQNRNFNNWKKKGPKDSKDWGDLEYAIREVVGVGKSTWVADHTQPVGAALEQKKVLAGQHVSQAAMNLAADKTYEALLPEWKLQSDPNAGTWLKVALRAVAPRLVTLFRQKQSRLQKEPSIHGEGNRESEGSAKGSTTTTTTKTAKPLSKPKVVIREKGKGKQVMAANVDYDPDTDTEERKHKSEGIDRNVYLRGLDRSIIVRIEGNDFPFVVGMHALLQEQHKDRGLDNLTHIHLCWETFSRLLKLAESRYDPEYSEESLEVKWTDPSSKAVQIIDNQSRFVRAVGILGNAAEDKGYVEMALS
jgi:hypothetical protein